MHYFMKTIVTIPLALVFVACLAPPKDSAVKEPDSAGTIKSDMQNTQGGNAMDDRKEPLQPVASDAPVPSKFTAAAIDRKIRYKDVATIADDQLPRLKLRNCFGYKRDEIIRPPAPIASTRRSRAPQKSGGKKASSSQLNTLLSGGGGSSASGAKRKMAQKPRPQPKPDMGAPAALSMAEAAPAESADMDAVAVPDMEEEKALIASDADYDVDDAPKAYNDWGAAIYLSNDDSMSLSSAQRVLYAIDNFLPLPAAHIRPHELLNYFTFDTLPVEAGHDFSVLPSIKADGVNDGVYNLGLSISGRPETLTTRRNVAVTWVLDRSGSMQGEGRMTYLKRGLKQSLSQLKDGDVFHMVLFDDEVCVPVENFVVGRDNVKKLERAINQLRPRGSTDIHSGLVRGYKVADKSHIPGYSNRVVLITDALANTGVTDEQMISTISKYYDTKKIRLSGVGVGRNFNDSLLDKLTEKGKGAYLFLGSGEEVDAVFGYGFISLVETVALDVHFKLHLPESLKMQVFYGEESSTVKADVQAIHYFANTSQLFLSDVVAKNGRLSPQDDIMLSVEYHDPETEEQLLEQYAFSLADVMKMSTANSAKGHLVMAFIDMLTLMSQRDQPQKYRANANSWVDNEAYLLCEDGKEKLAEMARDINADPEVKRVQQVWAKYCSRYQQPRNPVKREIAKPEPRQPKWPGARPE